tara:strand:- start:336 stop:1658 length:1323 start_codon:yes stop_codon:yes gene_type:complete
MKKIILFMCVFAFTKAYSQSSSDSISVYKKRVLESAEIDFLTSFYMQNGDNAAVSGGIGTEELLDLTGAIVISIPLNADDVLIIDAGVSTYTSASSSNIDPFDKKRKADPFIASSGASKEDDWTNVTASYSHSSDDRNEIWSAKASVSSEYDYFSAGAGGSYTKLFNQKNTELSVSANVFVDSWSLIYPVELRNSNANKGDDDDDDFNINDYTITGNPNYSPSFEPLNSSGRNSFSLGFGFSQILHKNIQGSLALDFIQQQGLLSTPFQRVYFSDVEDSFIENFHLADDVERLPDLRFKVAAGGRLNWYLNERITLRTFYRYYFDDWGITSHTASIEMPVKVSDYFTLYPSYRFYNQTASDYFNPYNEALSTDKYYTSDYDVSEYAANQFGFGVSYTDIFTEARIWKFGLKSVDLKFYQYDRNSSFTSSLITAGIKIVID